MRDKRENRTSGRGQSSDGRSAGRKSSDNNRNSFRKDSGKPEGSSYFDRKEEKRSSGFSSERSNRPDRDRNRDDERKSGFSGREEKRSFSRGGSESRDNDRRPSRFSDERKPRREREEKRPFSRGGSESRDNERKPSRFGDRDEKRSFSRGASESRDNDRRPSRFNDERRPRRERDEDRTFSRSGSESRDNDRRGRSAEISKYLEEFDSQNSSARKPRRETFKDLGYDDNSSRLIEKNSVEDETRNTYIYGRHPVIEALKGETPVNKVWIAEGTRDTDQVVEHAIERSIPYKIVTKTKLSYLVGESTNHQGVVAEVAGKAYTEFSDLIELTKQKEVFFIILDKVEDPHNLGAIIRTADAAGVDAIIVPKHRAVGLTGIVTKSSAGAIDRMKICRVPNLVQAVEELKKNNVWIVGVDMEGTEVYSTANLKGAIALTVGGEGEGLTRLVKEHCDFVVKIPMNSASNSLNVSVATAIVTFEIYKQKEFK